MFNYQTHVKLVYPALETLKKQIQPPNMAIYNTYTILTAEKAGIRENLRIGVVQMCRCEQSSVRFRMGGLRRLRQLTKTYYLRRLGRACETQQLTDNRQLNCPPLNMRSVLLVSDAHNSHWVDNIFIVECSDVSESQTEIRAYLDIHNLL